MAYTVDQATGGGRAAPGGRSQSGTSLALFLALACSLFVCVSLCASLSASVSLSLSRTHVQAIRPLPVIPRSLLRDCVWLQGGMVPAPACCRRRPARRPTLEAHLRCCGRHRSRLATAAARHHSRRSSCWTAGRRASRPCWWAATSPARASAATARHRSLRSRRFKHRQGLTRHQSHR